MGLHPLAVTGHAGCEPGVHIRVEPADGPLATRLLDAFVGEVATRLGGGFDPRRSPADPAELAPPTGRFLVAFDAAGEALGCGGVRVLDPRVAEIKRMWVAPAARRRGIARALLRALEGAARDLGASEVRLDTSVSLEEATALYRRSGYREIARYNDNPYAELWFAKHLR